MNSKILKLFVAATFVLSSLMFTACTSDKSAEVKQDAEVKKEETQPAEQKPRIEVIAKGFQHQFWKAVEQGSKQAGEEFNVDITFQGPDNESAIAQQVEYLNAAIAKEPAAICFAALDTKAAIDSINTAKDKHIPIIGFDSGVPDAPEGAIYANAATNNAEAGKLAATETYKIIKDKIDKATSVVRIGVVAQESNSQSIVSRTKGFVDEMVNLIGKDKVSVEGHEAFKNEIANPKVIIEVGIPAEVKDSDAAFVAQALLEKPDLIAIYGSNEFAANAIITANEGLDKIGEGKIVAVGFDAGKKLLDAIKAKKFVGAVTQNPVQIGYQAVKLAVMAAKGEKVSDVDTGALWYNAENMSDAKIAPCLYE